VRASLVARYAHFLLATLVFVLRTHVARLRLALALRARFGFASRARYARPDRCALVAPLWLGVVGCFLGLRPRQGVSAERLKSLAALVPPLLVGGGGVFPRLGASSMCFG